MSDPTLIHEDGTKVWMRDGKYHREDGPAIEYSSGAKFWYLNDQIHREDGPAVEYTSGIKLWYLHDRFITRSSQEEFDRLVKLKAFW